MARLYCRCKYNFYFLDIQLTKYFVDIHKVIYEKIYPYMEAANIKSNNIILQSENYLVYIF